MKNKLIEIKSCIEGKILFSAECDSIKTCLEIAVKSNINLEYANLDGANLDGANLNGASLDGARLNGASLDGARLNGASLNGASLVGASLDDANLDGARLVGARLDGAILVDASLDGAILVGARLDGASLVDASLVDASLDYANLYNANLPKIAKIDNLFMQIQERIESGCDLEMSNWHTCETVHCIAGWAIVLAGEAGRVAENLLGPDAAGALIINESCPYLNGKVPDFTSSNEEGMRFIEECAAKEKELLKK